MKIKRMLCIMATFVISMGAMTGCGSGTGNSSNNTTATTKNATQAAARLYKYRYTGRSKNGQHFK